MACGPTASLSKRDLRRSAAADLGGFGSAPPDHHQPDRQRPAGAGRQGDPDRALTLRTARGELPDTVILEVADNGPGVPDEARRRVFEPFYTTKPQGQGTGVGLSFSQGLAEAHGGRLELVPAKRGACFRLTLPIDPAPGSAGDARPSPWRNAEIPARRALVIDDEQEIAESLADFLSIEGFTCDVAVGGAEAQVWLLQGSYDLIVSDLRMPGIDGPAAPRLDRRATGPI
jgi:hypothetical protein